MIIHRIGGLPLINTYTSVYPPTQSSTYVKATTYYTTMYPYESTNPANSLTGTYAGNSWRANTGEATNQRFHIDLGSAKYIYKIYYENFHSSGGSITFGAKNFTFWGSNSATAFAELTYATDTNWEKIITDVTQMEQHVALDQADPKYIYIMVPPTAYRYYAFKIADNYTGSYIGIRRIELQEGA